MKTKILSIILLFVLVLSSISPLLLQLKIHLLKAEAGARLRRSHLQICRVPLQALHWTDYGEEMLINKKLFDVKEYHQDKNELIVTGIFDDEETLLKTQVDDSWQQNSKQNNLLAKYFQSLSDNYLPQNNFCIKEFLFTRNKYFTEVFLFRKNIFIEIPSSPPQRGIFIRGLI